MKRLRQLIITSDYFKDIYTLDVELIEKWEIKEAEFGLYSRNHAGRKELMADLKVTYVYKDDEFFIPGWDLE